MCINTFKLHKCCKQQQIQKYDKQKRYDYCKVKFHEVNITLFYNSLHSFSQIFAMSSHDFMPDFTNLEKKCMQKKLSYEYFNVKICEQ